jgi:hypothetical protein
MNIYYLKMSSCVSKNTYKYYFPDPAKGRAIWDLLIKQYGRPQENAYFFLKEIAAPKFTLRTTFLHDPLTIIVNGEPDEEFIMLHQTILKND